MPTPLSGPGVGLPFPQNLYPSLLNQAPIDPSSNEVGLAPGEVVVLPAGDWYVGLGLYLVLQYLDPVTNTWTMSTGAAMERGTQFVKSDGFSCRIANLTGCVVSASVVNGGTAYVQATTTLTVIGAGFTGAVPTMVPIVGGALKISGGTLTANGAGYGIAPIVAIPPPPPAQANANGVGGIQAAAIAIIASGTVSSISMINQGAGYPSAPTAVIIPSPFDPNLSTGITNATVTFTLGSSGVILGALVTNNGSPLPNGSLASVTISVGGAGSSGSLTANVLQTVVTGSISTISTGFSGVGGIFTAGGAPVAGIGNYPSAENIAFLPRQADMTGTLGTLGLAAIIDGGLFESAPSAALAVGPGATNTVGVVNLTMGSFYDIAKIQQAP